VRNQQTTQPWIALRVRPRCEKRVGNLLRQRGYEELVPLHVCLRRWSDREKKVELPLFPGYVFCRLNLSAEAPILTTPGVLHFVGIGRTPLPVYEHEISMIKAIIRTRAAAEPWPYLEAGDRVHIVSGPLLGLDGILVEHEGPRLVVSVSLLQRSVAVRVDPSWVIAKTPRIRPRSAGIAIERTA